MSMPEVDSLAISGGLNLTLSLEGLTMSGVMMLVCKACGTNVYGLELRTVVSQI